MIYVFCLIICFPFICLAANTVHTFSDAAATGTWWWCWESSSAGLSILSLLEHLLHHWSSPEAADGLATQIHKSYILC